MKAPTYAIVPGESTTASLGSGGGKLQAGSGPGQWIDVGRNPMFQLQFTDIAENTGIGFDDPVLGEGRRAVAVEAFALVSRLLAGEPGSARIRIRSDSAYLDSNTLAVGIPYFQCSPGFNKPIIFDALRNDLHVHEVEGELAINFDLPFNASSQPPPTGQYDLFTVILHEITHILGFVGFSVQQNGMPQDCGGARMLPSIAEFVTDAAGDPLWEMQNGEIRFTGQAADLPNREQPLSIELSPLGHGRLRLATDDLRVSGHWLPEDFTDRQGVLMLREQFASGTTRRNLTPETKAVLETALGYTVNEERRGLTGSWFDPATAGQGFSLHFVTREQFVIYFFGFTDSGERLWMIGVNDAGFGLGDVVSVNLYEATGGGFTQFDPGQVRELSWGRLEVNFRDCLSAVAQLDGLDGFQEMNLHRLAGVEGLECF